MMATNYSFGIERDDEVLKKNDLDHRKWTNPLEIRYILIYPFSSRKRSLLICHHPGDCPMLRLHDSSACTVRGRKPRYV